MRYFLFSLCFLCSTKALTQMHDNVWVLGRGGGNQSPLNDEWGTLLIDFTDPNKPLLIEKQEYDMNTDITNASFCDSMGNLLFYTNGEKIYNRNHTLMENGNGIAYWNGLGYLLAQGVVILPFPQHQDKYLMLAVEDSPDGTWGDKLLFHEIDLHLNNGLGKVVAKRQILVQDTVGWGKLTATKHANGRDWWFVLPPSYSNKYYIGSITPDGISIRTEIVGDTIREGLGQAFFSPNGEFYIKVEQVYLNQPATINIFDFDRCTGQLSNQRTHSVEPEEVDFGMGGAISRDSRYLYAFFTEKVLQYDLRADDIFNTETIVGVFDSFVSGQYGSYFLFGQVGPDGRIYNTGWSSAYHMHYIRFPEREGWDCGFVNHGIESPVNLSLAIPNFPNYRLGPIDGSACDTLGFDNHPLCNWRWEQEDTLSPLQVTFTDLSSYEPANWHWDFGDGTSSQDTSPVHLYPEEGIYKVCLVVSNQYSSDTLCRLVNLGVSGLEEASLGGASNRFLIMPNPANEQLHIVPAFEVQVETKFELFGILGQRVWASTLPIGFSGASVNLSDLPSGVYLYRISHLGKTLQSNQVVISH